MGLFNDLGNNTTVEQGLKGDKGDNGVGFVLTSDGNYNIENKKLVNLQAPTNDNDAVSKIYLDSIPGVSLTRSIKKAGGLFMEGVRLDGLPNPPPSLSSATSKAYVDGQDNIVKAYVNTKDQAMRNYVNQGDAYRYISTLNEFQLESRDFSNTDNKLSLFDYGGNRDFTNSYHKAKSHAILTLSGSPCVLTVTLRNLLSGPHGLRIEAIINSQDDHSVFDTDVTMTSANNINLLSTDKVRYGNYAISLHLSFELTADMSQHNIDSHLSTKSVKK